MIFHWIEIGLLSLVLFFLIIVFFREELKRKVDEEKFSYLEKKLTGIQLEISTNFSSISHKIQMLDRSLEDIRRDSRSLTRSATVLETRMEERTAELISSTSAVKSITNTVSKRGRPRKNPEEIIS